VKSIPEIAPAPAWTVQWAATRSGRVATSPVIEGQAPAYVNARATGTSLAARGLANFRQPEAPIGDVAAALEALPNPDLGWDDFNRICMAVYAATGGSEAGRELVRSWARKSKKHRDEEIDERWQHYGRSPPTEIGYGALVWEVRRTFPDWCPPSRIPVAVVPSGELSAAPDTVEVNIFDESTETTKEMNGVNGHAALPPQFTQGSLENPLIMLNKKHAVIGDIGGKCLVLSWVHSKVDEAIKVPSFQTFKSFSERYANQYVLVKSEDKKGNVVEEPKQLGPYWLKWTKRRNYEGIDLVPGAGELLPGGYLNLWSGFAFVPTPGGWPTMKRHIREVLAGGSDEIALYIVRWAAWAVQNPGERAEVALVFRGDKGSGKGTFANAMKRLFGQHGLQIFNSKHLVGTFNSHLRNCILLFADEAFWAGDKQGESVLKGMLTEPALVIEQKGVDAMAWKNRLHVIMAANAEWVVPASHDERRYAVIDVSDKKVGDVAWFRELHKEMANGGQSAMLHDLLRFDLGDWHPRAIVHTEALRLQKERSMDPRWQWYESLLQQGWLPEALGESLNITTARALIDNLKDFDPKFNTNPTALGRFLRERLCEKTHTAHGNQWKFLDLSAARQRFEKEWGKWNWDENFSDWRMKGDMRGSTIQGKPTKQPLSA
jgi:hypothetical protein